MCDTATQQTLRRQWHDDALEYHVKCFEIPHTLRVIRLSACQMTMHCLPRMPNSCPVMAEERWEQTMVAGCIVCSSLRPRLALEPPGTQPAGMLAPLLLPGAACMGAAKGAAMSQAGYVTPASSPWDTASMAYLRTYGDHGISVPGSLNCKFRVPGGRFQGQGAFTPSILHDGPVSVMWEWTRQTTDKQIACDSRVGLLCWQSCTHLVYDSHDRPRISCSRISDMRR